MGLATGNLYRNLIKEYKNQIVLEGDLLRKLQLELVKITEDIVEVCDACGATYFLIGGNMLGAVRHHGFIPWDDDMDLGILSKDYDKFINLFREKYEDKYWIHNEDTANHCSSITHICWKNSVYRGIGQVGKSECGIPVEINKVENVPDNPVLRLLHGILCNGIGLLMSCRYFYENRKTTLVLTKNNIKAKFIFSIKIGIGWATQILSVQSLNKFTQYCCGLCKNENSKYMNIPRGRKHYFGDMYFRFEFVQPKHAEFEGHMWNVPANPDRYLSILYGDYMMIPPKSNQDRYLLCELVFPEED